MKDNRELNQEEKNKYATWVIEECNTPIDELEWLVSELEIHAQLDIRELLNQIKK